ncbi:hypothetical protein UQ68_10495, partial [Listeria seeligeri]
VLFRSSGKTSIIGAGSGYSSEAAWAFMSPPEKFSSKTINNKAKLRLVNIFFKSFIPFFFLLLKDNISGL